MVPLCGWWHSLADSWESLPIQYTVPCDWSTTQSQPASNWHLGREWTAASWLSSRPSVPGLAGGHSAMPWYFIEISKDQVSKQHEKNNMKNAHQSVSVIQFTEARWRVHFWDNWALMPPSVLKIPWFFQQRSNQSGLQDDDISCCQNKGSLTIRQASVLQVTTRAVFHIQNCHCVDLCHAEQLCNVGMP